jgi:hypothetical protein
MTTPHEPFDYLLYLGNETVEWGQLWRIKERLYSLSQFMVTVFYRYHGFSFILDHISPLGACPVTFSRYSY